MSLCKPEDGEDEDERCHEHKGVFVRDETPEGFSDGVEDVVYHSVGV